MNSKEFCRFSTGAGSTSWISKEEGGRDGGVEDSRGCHETAGQCSNVLMVSQVRIVLLAWLVR